MREAKLLDFTNWDDRQAAIRIREKILQQKANMTWMSRENSAQQKVYRCTKWPTSYKIKSSHCKREMTIHPM